MRFLLQNLFILVVVTSCSQEPVWKRVSTIETMNVQRYEARFDWFVDEVHAYSLEHGEFQCTIGWFTANDEQSEPYAIVRAWTWDAEGKKYRFSFRMLDSAFERHLVGGGITHKLFIEHCGAHLATFPDPEIAGAVREALKHMVPEVDPWT